MVLEIRCEINLQIWPKFAFLELSVKEESDESSKINEKKRIFFSVKNEEEQKMAKPKMAENGQVWFYVKLLSNAGEVLVLFGLKLSFYPNFVSKFPSKFFAFNSGFPSNRQT